MVQKIKSVVISAFISSLIIVLCLPMAFTDNGNAYEISHLGNLYNGLFTWITISLFALGVPTSVVAGKLVEKLPPRFEIANRMLILAMYVVVAFLLRLSIREAIQIGFVIFIIVVVVYFVVNDWLINRENQRTKPLINRVIQLGIFCYLASMILAGVS